MRYEPIVMKFTLNEIFGWDPSAAVYLKTARHAATTDKIRAKRRAAGKVSRKSRQVNYHNAH